MAEIDHEKIAGIIRECAAKYVTPRFRQLQDDEVRSKSHPGDLVTIADIEMEEALERILEDLYPDCSVIGEESISAGTKDLNVLLENEGIVFVADPVDGTRNFVRGNETFCVMLACVIDGVCHSGWIYDVPKDRMMIAIKGEGAHLEGETLHVSDVKNINQGKGYINRSYFSRRFRDHVAAFITETDDLKSLNCAGHEYLRIAAGKRDYSFNGLAIRPWDHLPGTLAVIEAGGIACRWDGKPYMPQDELEGLVVASTPELFTDLQGKIINKLNKEK